MKSSSLKVTQQNIVLSSGSTMFDHFGQWFKQDLKNMVDRCIVDSEVLSGSAMQVCAPLFEGIEGADFLVQCSPLVVLLLDLACLDSRSCWLNLT